MRSTARTGRIPASEWPEIVSRRENGETYAAIARDYGVTGPAIKYIVDKAQAGEAPETQAADSRPDEVEESGHVSAPDTTAEVARAGDQASDDAKRGDARRGRLGLGERAAAPAAAAPPDTKTAAADEPEPVAASDPSPKAPAGVSALAQRLLDAARDCASVVERFETGERGPALDEGLKKAIHDLRRAVAAIEIERDRASVPPPIRRSQGRGAAPSPTTGQSSVPAEQTEQTEGGETVEGTVKFFHADKGFGFVVPDHGGSDIYVPLRALKSSGLSSLQAEQRVRVSVIAGAKGPEADEVEPVAA